MKIDSYYNYRTLSIAEYRANMRASAMMYRKHIHPAAFGFNPDFTFRCEMAFAALKSAISYRDLSSQTFEKRKAEYGN